MANNELTNKYFIKRKSTDTYADITTQFSGIRVLSVDGFNEYGDAVNVYTEQWIDSHTEDVMVTKQDGNGNDVIIRKNVELQMTVIVSRRYTNSAISEQTVYNSLRAYLDGGAFYIKSAYTGMEAHVICLSSFKPTAQQLQRGDKSYILATIPLHCIDKPTAV